MDIKARVESLVGLYALRVMRCGAACHSAHVVCHCL